MYTLGIFYIFVTKEKFKNMGNYSDLKAAINLAIRTNGRMAITGAVLNSILNRMVSSLGTGYQFVGVATPETNPGEPDQNVVYIATEEGTYTHFDGTVLPKDCIGIFTYNGSWSSSTVEFQAPLAFDETPTENSGNPVKSGGIKTYVDKQDVFEKGTGTNSVQQKGTGSGASGNSAFATGEGTIASGRISHTEGYHTVVSSNETDKLNSDTRQVNGEYGHAEGNGSIAIGSSSHTEGKDNRAIGHYSHAEGEYTEARGARTHTEGRGTVATNYAEHAQGKYNVSNSGSTDKEKTIHSIGIGNSSRPKNAFEVMTNGDIYVLGLGGYDGTNAGASGVKTLQQLLGSGTVLNI